MAQVPQISVLDGAGVARDVATITALISLIGDLTATPPANSELDRLKTIGDEIGAIGASPAANTVQDRLKTLGTLATALNALIGEVQANPTANTVLDRLKAINTSLAALLTGPLVTAPQSAGHDVQVTITRPGDTTAYSAGDVVGGVLQFTAAGKTGGGSTLVTGVQLQMNISAAPASAFRLHLYSVTPPSALADNAPWDLPSGDRGAGVYLGSVDIPVPTDLGSTCFANVSNVNMQMKLATANCFGYLQTISAWTPGSGDVYLPTLHTVDV